MLTCPLSGGDADDASPVPEDRLNQVLLLLSEQ